MKHAIPEAVAPGVKNARQINAIGIHRLRWTAIAANTINNQLKCSSLD
jgi:hypothetical protein